MEVRLTFLGMDRGPYLTNAIWEEIGLVSALVEPSASKPKPRLFYSERMFSTIIYATPPEGPCKLLEEARWYVEDRVLF
jgi:hypothetical protein